MMKMLLASLALLNLLSSPPSHASVDAAVSEESAALEKWASEFGIPFAPRAKVEFVEPWRVKGSGGETKGDRIQINKRVPREQLRQVLRHELAHVFLSSALPEAVRGNLLVQETYALLLSGDDQRVRREQSDFSTQSAAFNYLRRRSYVFPKATPMLMSALARLLAAPETSRELRAELTTITERRLLEILGQSALGAHRGAISYLVVDARTGETLDSRGGVDEPAVTGSMLKPVILRLYPEMLASQKVGAGTVWECAPFKGARMSWQTALQTSCNGFFLSVGGPWKRWAEYLARFGVPRSRSQALSAQEAIGLVPQVKLSLREVADIYREIDRVQPEILRALEGTVESGTLSHVPASSFFKGAMLKTGTVRTLKGRPLHGWVGGRIGDVFIFARASGYGGSELLPELKSIAAPWKHVRLRPAAVQVLGLVPSGSVEWSCGRGEISRANDTISCATGALRARFPAKGGKISRDYWGTVRVSAPKPVEAPTLKQARARSGSSYILETTERSYVARVLAAEMASGRSETLKALAFVVRQNLSAGRHGDRPLCDTTHCQVFGPANAKLGRYTRAYDAIAHLPVKSEFLNFSKGGRKPWRAKRTVAEVGSMESSCEKMRSRLKLLSCPSKVTRQNDVYVFEGEGEGHGVGLDLMRADALAARGEKFTEILSHFF